MCKPINQLQFPLEANAKSYINTNIWEVVYTHQFNIPEKQIQYKYQRDMYNLHSLYAKMVLIRTRALTACV